MTDQSTAVADLPPLDPPPAPTKPTRPASELLPYLDAYESELHRIASDLETVAEWMDPNEWPLGGSGR